MDSILASERRPQTLPPVVHVAAQGYKAHLPDTAFNPVRALWQHLQDPEGWQNIRPLLTYGEWAQKMFMEQRIADAHMRGIDPQTIRDFDRDIVVINSWINRGVTAQSQADKVLYEVRALLGVRE